MYVGKNRFSLTEEDIPREDDNENDTIKPSALIRSSSLSFNVSSDTYHIDYRADCTDKHNDIKNQSPTSSFSPTTIHCRTTADENVKPKRLFERLNLILENAENSFGIKDCMEFNDGLINSSEYNKIEDIIGCNEEKLARISPSMHITKDNPETFCTICLRCPADTAVLCKNCTGINYNYCLFCAQIMVFKKCSFCRGETTGTLCVMSLTNLKWVSDE